MPEAREKQVTALNFITRAVEAGVYDIVIAAPTGSGKTNIGVAACYWAAEESSIPGAPGGYYLVTQKLLQDQLENDFERFLPGFHQGTSLKSSCEYSCPKFKRCSVGLSSKKGCPRNSECTYRLVRGKFASSRLGVTNYPYFLTERMHVGKFLKRRVIVLDECHTLERQLIRFVDLTISESTLPQWAPDLEEVPELPTLDKFSDWVTEVYLPAVKERSEVLAMIAEDGDDKSIQEAFALEQHCVKIAKAIELIESDPKNWVYWQAKDADDKLESTARPLDAAPFSHLVRDMGTVKIYLSAFPGEKRIFCESLGLNPRKVAWCSLKSTFPKENRPIIIAPIGSMSRRNLDDSLPRFFRVTEKLLLKHASEKGLIHCNSYALGKLIFDKFSAQFGQRLIFPRSGGEREEAFLRHKESQVPTVIITPSMAEGFDFHGDLARWQIIAKVPYPSLSDKQVVAKKELNEDWYCLETVKTIIQAAGRIVRSEQDTGTTYILDSDFERLYERYTTFFPNWFTEAFVRTGSSSRV
jgi:Rad3-related DNA helicase